MTDSKPAELLDFGNDFDGNYQLVTSEELLAMRSHALRAVLYTEEPVTVYDDPPDSPGAPGLREPRDAWFSGHAARVARTVVVKQPRFLVRATERSNQIHDLQGRIRGCEQRLEQAERDKRNAEAQRDEEAAAHAKAETKVADLNKSVDSLRSQFQASERDKERLERLLSGAEDSLLRLRTLLGDELMDAVLDKAGTLEAAAAKRQAMDALGPNVNDE